MEIRKLNSQTGTTLLKKKETKEKKPAEPKDGLVGSALNEQPVITKEMVMEQVKPKGKFGQAHDKGVETTIDWNEKVGGAVGVMGGLMAGTAGVYAGILGGAATGAVTGMSVGPAVAVLKGAEGLSFIGEVFGAGGTVAKAAIVAGSICAGVGGFVAGKKLAESVSGIPISIVAYPVGFAKGLVGGAEEAGEVSEKPETDKPKVKIKVKSEDGAITKTLEGVAGAIGLITGGAGGAVLGAGIGGATALTAGVIAENVTWAAMGTGGVIGAVAGAVLIGGMSAVGGYTLVDKGGKILGWAKDKIMPDKDKIALKNLRRDVAEKEAVFSQKKGEVQGLTNDLESYFTNQSAALDTEQVATKEYIDNKEAGLADKTSENQAYIKGQQDKLDKKEAEVKAADGEIEGIINGKADGIFAEIKKPTDEKYAGLHKELDDYQGKLEARDKELSGREKSQATEIENMTVASYEEKMVPVNKHYTELNDAQGVREQEHKDWDTKLIDDNKTLDKEIKDEGLADYKKREPGLEKEFEQKEADLRQDYKGKTEDANQDHRKDLDRLFTQHQTDMDKLEDKYNVMNLTLSQKSISLDEDKRDLNREKNQLISNISSAEIEEMTADRKLSNANQRFETEVGGAKRERDSAVRNRDTKRRELSSLNSDISSAKGKRDKYVREKAKIDAKIPGLRSTKSRLQSQLAQIKK